MADKNDFHQSSLTSLIPASRIFERLQLTALRCVLA